MRKFLKRTFSHKNSENIRVFYESLKTAIDPKLYEIKFHSSFGLYLYLYLKSKAVGYMDQSPEDFTISKPIQINFTKVAQEAGIARNTVKAAFKELLRLNIVFESVIPIFNNKVKECSILNSKYFIGYDENEHKVIYSMNSQERENL
ncbi:hypothetical protein [Flavobacterium filum]|uniref:hypothetical protein n=1 Tax=Flavobacterium filum TaxID=370974 RepID=UPI0023EF732A|nr:hypothetical protein [Flavobacterium filum]